MHKGQKEFVTTVANIDNSLLLVIDSHKQEEIIEVLMQQPFEVRFVTEVSVDMWEALPKSFR